MHLLVVDPNVAFGTLLQEELARLGHRVDMCNSSANALSLVTSDPPDLALLDMALQAPDALALGHQLRALREDVRLMLIPMMGQEPVLTSEAPAIQGVLPKPFFLPDLPGHIEAALRAPLDHNGADPAVAAVTEARDPMSGGAAEGRAGLLEDDHDLDALEALFADTEAEDDLDWLAALDPLDDDEGGLADLSAKVEQTTGQELWAEATVESSEVAAAPTESPVIPPPDPPVDAPDPVAEAAPVHISRRTFRTNQGRIESLMSDLAAEVGADSVILTCDTGVMTAVGGLQEDEIASISAAVLSGFRTSAEMARVLGREQLRFEQSIAGGSYLLYALGIDETILAVTVSGDAPLGLLRHRARMTAERIADLCR